MVTIQFTHPKRQNLRRERKKRKNRKHRVDLKTRAELQMYMQYGALHVRIKQQENSGNANGGTNKMLSEMR